MKKGRSTENLFLHFSITVVFTPSFRDGVLIVSVERAGDKVICFSFSLFYRSKEVKANTSRFGCGDGKLRGGGGDVACLSLQWGAAG